MWAFTTVGLLLVISVLSWRSSEKTHRATACETTLASAKADVIDAGAQLEATCKSCSVIAREEGRVEGYKRAQQDREEVRAEAKALTKPKCNPLVAPYSPCCGEDAMPGGITEDAWPTPEEFTARHTANGRLLTLSCARTTHQKSEQGAPWVCGRTEARCTASKQRAGVCNTCYVHLASGRMSGEDFVWTGHALDEVDGPWDASGKRGVFP